MQEIRESRDLELARDIRIFRIRQVDRIQRIDLQEGHRIGSVAEKPHPVQRLVRLTDLLRPRAIRQRRHGVEMPSGTRLAKHIQLVVDEILVGPVEL